MVEKYLERNSQPGIKGGTVRQVQMEELPARYNGRIVSQVQRNEQLSGDLEGYGIPVLERGTFSQVQKEEQPSTYRGKNSQTCTQGGTDSQVQGEE